MRSRQTKLHRIPAVSTLLALLLGSTPLHADRILVIGDSWASPIAPELQTVLHENGHTDIAVDATPYMSHAWRMLTRASLDDITAWLDERPDVTVVQMSIGANDWLGSGWKPSWADTAEERSLIAGIIRNVEVGVDHIFSLRPDIQILWSSSDFPRPVDRGLPVQINTFLITFAEQRAQFAATKPGLSFVDLNGTLQVTYGFDGLQHTRFDPGYVIPPGDPSLPDRSLPSPFEPFKPNDNWHLIPSGYKAVAQAQYDGFYASALDGDNFHINAGHAGAWYNPDTSGQGQFIDVEPETQFMFVSWFTYTDAASDNPFEQRWLTAQGNYSGNKAELDLFETLGGQFNDPQAVTTTRIGHVSLSFSECGLGEMAYKLDEERLQGSFPLNRVIPGSGNVCEERGGNATQAVDINAGMDGAWFDTNTPGQGFFIDVHPDPEGGNFIFVSWFTYGGDTASGLCWLTAQGGFEGSIAEIDVFEVTGGSFDNPQPVSTVNVGTMSIDFTDCNHALLTYSLTDDSAEGDIEITRVIPEGKALCEELAGAD